MISLHLVKIQNNTLIRSSLLKVHKKLYMLQKLQNELIYTEGFLKSVRKKLNNKKFTENAPKIVIENELKKESDAIKKIEILKKNISLK